MTTEKETKEVWEAVKDVGGRPPIYDDPSELLDNVMAYLQWVKDNPLFESKAFGTGLVADVPHKRYPTASGCAIFCGVGTRTWRNWKEAGHRLKDVVDWAEEIMLQIKMEGAACGFFNSTIVSRDLGLRDKSEVDQTMTVNIIDNFGENDEDK